MHADQSRAKLHGRTIRSRNVRGDDSESSQPIIIDETTDSEYITNPRKDPPHVCSPVKNSTTLPRGSEVINELRTQFNDSNSDKDGLIITDSKQVRCSR